jgi:hypothetical protein
MYLLPYTGITTVSSGNCPVFSCATSSFLLMLTAGPPDHFLRWRLSRRRIYVCSVLRCPDLWFLCGLSFVHVLKKTHHTIIMSLLNRARNSRCAVITDLDTSKRSTQKAFSCCDTILETGPAAPRPRSKHGERTVCIARETSTVSSVDSVCCACVGREIILYQPLKPHHSFVLWEQN